MPPIFDGHNDSLTSILNMPPGRRRSFLLGSELGQVDLPRAREGGLSGGIFAIFTPAPPGSPETDPMDGITFTSDGYIQAERSPIDPDYAADYSDAVIDFAHDLEEVSEGAFRVATTYAGLEACLAEGELAAVLALEGAEAIRPDLRNLEDYYRKGIRSIGPVWSRPNIFGTGVPFRFPGSPDTGPGLTAAGRSLIRACNELGILVDLAHLNERGFWDAVEVSTAPLVVSHADVHAICPATRNLTDAQIDSVARSGGLIGINFEAMNTSPTSSVDRDVPLRQITAHIDYIAQRVGVDHVAFGSDFDGAELPLDLSDVRGLPKLLAELVRAGYDRESLEKITCKNWLRVLKAAWRG